MNITNKLQYQKVMGDECKVTTLVLMIEQKTGI